MQTCIHAEIQIQSMQADTLQTCNHTRIQSFEHTDLHTNIRTYIPKHPVLHTLLKPLCSWEASDVFNRQMKLLLCTVVLHTLYDIFIAGHNAS